MSDFFDFLGDALIPNEIAPYLGMLAPMVAPQLGITGSMILSQLGSMKMNEGAFDPYSAIATGIALSSPQARAIRRAGRLDPTRGTVGQRLSAGIAASLPAQKVGGLNKAGTLYRALDPRLSIGKNEFGNYYENPMLASSMPIGTGFIQGRLDSPFDKSKFRGQNTLMSDTEFNKQMQETIDYTYGKDPALGDDFTKAQAKVEDQTVTKKITDSEGNVTTVEETTKGTPYKNPVFEKYLPSRGFKLLEPNQPLINGDLLAMSILGKGLNHVAIFIDGDVLHHLSDRLSCREPYNAWLLKCTGGRYRYVKQN